MAHTRDLLAATGKNAVEPARIVLEIEGFIALLLLDGLAVLVSIILIYVVGDEQVGNSWLAYFAMAQLIIIAFGTPIFLVIHGYRTALKIRRSKSD